MKILLIKPPLNPRLIAPSRGEPLELEYLAAAVQEHKVEILDMRIDSRLAKKLDEFKPDFVGLTGYTCDANTVKAVLKEVKKLNGRIVTGVGGHHATFLPEDFALPFVDVIFLGMADLSFKEFVRVMEAGEDFRSVNNLALRSGDALSFTERAAFAVDLNQLPFPARHLTDQYRKRYRDQWRNKTSMILTSRGCPFRCHFCACWKLLQGKYLVRSPESVVDELATLPEDADLVFFADDNSLHNVRLAWRLCRLIEERKIRRKYSMYARADTIVNHPDLIEAMRDVGLVSLTVGIEAVRDEELQAMEKKTTVAMNNEAVRILQRLGIANIAHFIVDPDYSKEDFQRLFEYVDTMDLFQPVFTVLTPYPGTELYQSSRDRIVIKNFDYFDVVHSVFPTRLSRREFYRQIESLYVKCYSFKRYCRSLLRERWRSWRNKRAQKLFHPDRLPFFIMLLLPVLSFPLRLRFRKAYNTEGFVV
jgi:radical SAM superfamily enzyme YgiQ (UPF0313 family)